MTVRKIVSYGSKSEVKEFSLDYGEYGKKKPEGVTPEEARLIDEVEERRAREHPEEYANAVHTLVGAQVDEGNPFETIDLQERGSTRQETSIEKLQRELEYRRRPHTLHVDCPECQKERKEWEKRRSHEIYFEIKGKFESARTGIQAPPSKENCVFCGRPIFERDYRRNKSKPLKPHHDKCVEDYSKNPEEYNKYNPPAIKAKLDEYVKSLRSEGREAPHNNQTFNIDDYVKTLRSEA